MRRAGSLVLGVAVTLLGCPVDRVDDDDTSEPPGTECDEGLVDDDGVCVPEACGVGTWGDLERPADAVYVFAAAGSGGDGSEAEPLDTIQAGLDRAAEMGATAVAVGAGTYAENVELGSQHDGIHLMGRCAELVLLDGSPDPYHPGLLSVVQGGSFEASGLTIGNSQIGGVWRVRGGLTLHDLVVAGNVHRGVFAEGMGDLVLEDVVIRDTTDTVDDPFGYGLVVFGGATAQVTRTVIERSTRHGLLVLDAGTEVTLADVEIRDTHPNAEEKYGHGITVDEGALLLGERVVLAGNTGTGLQCDEPGSEVQLDELTIVDTGPKPDGTRGFGVEVQGGGAVSLSDSTVERSTTVGVVVTGVGSLLTLDAVSVQETRTGIGGQYGRGALVTDGAALVARDSAFTDNAHTGIKAEGPGSTVDLERVEVSDTRTDELGLDGAGIYLFDGAVLTAVDCTLERNHSIALQLNELDTPHPDAVDTAAYLDGVEIRDTQPDDFGEWGAGIQMSDGAELVMDDVLLEGQHGTSLSVFGPGTEASLTGTTIASTRFDSWGFGIGAQAVDGGQLTAVQSTFDDNGGVAVEVYGAGTVVSLEEVEIRNTRSNPAGDFGRAIEVIYGATLTVTGGVIEDNRDAGVFVSETGTSATLSGLEILRTGRVPAQVAATGVVCQKDATMVADDLTVTGSEGPGIHVVQCALTCTGCTLDGNAFAGVSAVGNTTLALHQCSISNTEADANTGGGVGLYALPIGILQPSVILEQSTISGHPMASVWLAGAGSYQIDGNDLEGGGGIWYEYPSGGQLRFHGNAVYATGGTTAWDEPAGTGLLLSSNELHAAQGAAVLFHAATGTLTGNVFSGNTLDLQQQACDGHATPVGVETAPSAVLCPAYDELVLDLSFSMQFDEAGLGG